MGDDPRQWRSFLRLDVNEGMSFHDFGDEIRVGVDSRFRFAPVDNRCPVARERLHGCRAVRLCVSSADCFPFRPLVALCAGANR